MYTHTCVITQLVHTQLVHTHNFLTHNLSTHNLLTHNLSFLTSTFVTGVALGDIHLRFTWQAWHLQHWAGSGGAPGSHGSWRRGRRGSLRGRRGTRWQAWHLATSTFVSRGRRGTWSHPHSFHVAGAALGQIQIRFTWQAWHLVTSTFVSRGRRGTYSTGRALVAHRVLMAADAVDAVALCVAGVALGDIHLHFAWQAWQLVTSTFTLRGRRGTTWQAWH